MPTELTNHLWQSTLFVVVAGLLTAALRKNRAQVRYWIWFSASLKFLAPFALLMSLGSYLPAPKKITVTPVVTIAMRQIAQPFSGTAPVSPATPATRDWLPIAIICVWACGFLCVALIRLRDWLRIRAAMRSSIGLNLPAAVEVRSSPGLLEPGVVGLLRPVLLLPDGITQHLTPPQLEAVLAHELCHVRRRDNLTAAIHMVVEAMFWFHPLVWWIGARLVEERERACDEAVLSLGSEPRVYAEGILNVCKLYVESPLACVSGVTGSDLKKRIHAILTERVAGDLNFAKKLALAVAGMAAVAAPIVVGVMHAPPLRAQSGQAQSPQIVTQAPQIVAQAQAASPQLLAQAQTAPAPGGRGRGATPQSAPAATPPDGLRPALEFLMDRIEARYGPPDQIDDRSSDAQNPVKIWRYNYLEDFRSNVELEFAQGRPMHINFPLPATFYGQPGIPAGLVARSLPAEFFHGSDPPAENTIAGFPGGRASMQIYSARYYRMLSVPMDSLSGAVDIIGLIRTISGERPQSVGLKPPATATVRDYIKNAPAGPYTAPFTLDAGSYVCAVVVREQGTGRVYGETINFEVK
jgi:beta-lactamase regulating signal transducer with metallopeptidase domain